MSTIKKVKKIKSTNKNSLSKQPFKKTLHTHTNKEVKKISIKEIMRVTTNYLKHFAGLGRVTMSNILSKTQPIDIERSTKQLSAILLRYEDDGLFIFTVKSSGLHKVNEWGIHKSNKIAKSHQVNIWFDLSEKAIKKYKTPHQIFSKTKIKFECSCGRHTYWYRYMATKGGWGLGIKEERFPRIRNPQLKGICCKHVVRAVRYCHGHAFQKEFNKELRLLTRQ
jgi:uncharacterized protein YlbG (UPF0298 family)